jgi:Holliday junction resolvasome RuvABC endonuclease subunit
MKKQKPWSKQLLNPDKPITILAISPGTRYVAVAVFEDNDLIYSTIKTVSTKGKIKSDSDERNTQQLLQRVSKLVANFIYAYQPDMVVQEKLYYIQCKTSDKLPKLVQQIKKIVQKMQVDYVEYPPTVVRQQICQQEKATKKNAFTILAARYSDDLGVKTGTEKLCQDKYRDRLFNAVALGHYCLQKLKKQ